METTIISLLISPRDYFREHPQALDSLKIPVLIVLVTAIVGAIYGFEIGSLTGTLMGPSLGGMGTIIAAISGVGAFFGGILMWVIAAGIFLLISMVFKGTGAFRKVLAAVGLGMIPQLFGGIVTLVLTFVYLPMV
ncbi:MAG: YIP1 family protein, partial [Methanomicrobiales archaeon]|nr:YIP1 family protein [Methanomicrobiales archaeon]